MLVIRTATHQMLVTLVESQISKILNFGNSNFKTCRMSTKMDNLNLKCLCLDNLKTNQRSQASLISFQIYNLLNSAF